MKKILFLLLCAITTHAFEQKTFLVWGGKTGWIGQKMVTIIQGLGHKAVCAESRLENREQIIREIEQYQPDYLVNAAGITGKPNVDWCETHKQETMRTNMLGVLNLADIAYMHNIHVTNITTGCIYEYNASHPMGSGIGFTEEEAPNFDGSFYSRIKIKAESLILEYPNVLNLRIKMPVSTELDKGFVGKIIRYKKLINVPNSLAILDDLLPIAVDMTLRQITGNFNFVNPGAMSHNEVLELYKEYIDPTFTYGNFTLEEQDKILKARRSNAELSAEKLLSYYPDVPHVKQSLRNIFETIKKNTN